MTIGSAKKTIVTEVENMIEPLQVYFTGAELSIGRRSGRESFFKIIEELKIEKQWVI